MNEIMIQCFLSLTKTLSFTETAKELYMTQQSVSKYIAKLEDELGFRLFARTHHYVNMTKAGEEFRILFSRFESELSELTGRMRSYYSGLYSSLRIGHLEWLEISSAISGSLKLVKINNPNLKIIIEKHPQFELNELFYDRKLDLIITYKEFAPKGIGIKKMKALETPLVLLVSPDNPAVCEEASAADFKNEPFIKAAASRESQSASRKRALRQCREFGFTPSEIIISPNLESAYMAAELGQGVLISTMLSRMSLHSELLCYKLGKNEELQCFWHEEQENPAVENFANCIEKMNPKGW